MRERLDWNDLAVLAAIADAGSLTRAAVAQRLSVATLSRRLDALETLVGHRLFDRLPNKLAPTLVGQLLIERALAVRGETDAFLRTARSLALGATRVRLTATQSMSLFLVEHLDALGQLRTRDGTLVALEIDATRQSLSLARREADLAIRMRRPPREGDLVVRRLGSVAMSLYATRALASRAAALCFGAPSRRDATRFSDVPIVASLRQPGLSRQEAWLASVVPDTAVRYRLSETALRWRAIRGGLGAGLMACFAGDGDPELVRLVAPPAALVEDAFLLVHRDLKDDPTLATVAQALVTLFKAQRSRLTGQIRDVDPACKAAP